MKKILLAGLALSGAVHADINNEPFTFIGFAGGPLSYKESGTLSSGTDFETTPSNFAVMNYSGGYTAIGERGGFYINTVSTLYASTDSESWEFSKGNISGEHQKNQVTSNHNGLDILGAYLLGGGHQLIAGIGYTRTLLDRNSFENGSDIDAFNNANFYTNATPTGTATVGGSTVDCYPDAAGGASATSNESGDDSCLELSELKSYYGLSPEDKIVNYTETFTSFVAQVGYRYDTRFKSSDTGSRWQWGVTLGLPVYFDVVNTSRPSLEFNSYLKGYDVNTYFGYGWRFTENVGVLAKANYSYRLRDEIKVKLGYNEELGRQQYASIPENIVSYWNVGLNGYWNF